MCIATLTVTSRVNVITSIRSASGFVACMLIAIRLIATMRGVLEVLDDYPEIWPSSGQEVRKTARVATPKA